MKKILCLGALIATLMFSSCKKEERGSTIEYNMKPEAMKYFDEGIQRMEEAGANYNARQVYTMLSCADEDHDYRISVKEAQQLHSDVLNPDAPLGKLALQYDGPDLPKAKPQGLVNEKWKELFMNLMDKDKDRVITKKEVLQGAYQMQH